MAVRTEFAGAPPAPEYARAAAAEENRVRPEIQGLRAVAVLLVVTYHLWPGKLPGGYIGVDVFFVISGFLITSHLMRETATHGRVRLAAFWARRARRLLPAAYLVLTATAVAVAVWVPRLYWPQFFKEIGASTLYVENWSLARDSVDYLAQSNNPSPVQHYWTLSAEEQFYLVWPLLVTAGMGLAWLFRARGRHRPTKPRGRVAVPLVLGAATAVSLAYSLHETAHNPDAAYFITTTRAWEFGAGALLGCVAARPGAALAWLRAAASWAGLGALAYLGLHFRDTTPMPGTGAVFVVVATMAVIAAGHPRVAWSPTRLLALRPVQFVGDISYSIYLWHWPLIILLPYVLGHAIGFGPRVGILVATVVLSWLTKRFVEDPIRTGRRWRLRTPSVSLGWAALGAACVVAISAVGVTTAEHEQSRERAAAQHEAANAPPCFGAAAMAPDARNCPNPHLADTLVPSPTAAATDYPRFAGCTEKMRATPLRPCRFGDPTKSSAPHIAVIGDSHAAALMSGLERLVAEKRLTADLFTSGGCDWATGPPPILTKSLADACSAMRGRLKDLLLRTATDYDFIVTTSWAGQLRGDQGSRVDAIAKAWQPVARQGVPIVAVRDNPFAGAAASADPNKCLSKVAVSEANDKCALRRSTNLDRTFDPYRGAVERTPGAHYVDLSSFYCTGDHCPVVIGGVDVYRDNSHISTTYARTLAPYVYRAFERAGVVPGS